MKKIIALLFIGLIMLTPMSLSAQRMVITDDLGGEVSDYIDRWNDYRQRGVRVVIDGTCASACVRFMTLPNVCATPRGVFLMHAINNESGLDPEQSREDTLEWETHGSFVLQEKYGAFYYGTTRHRPKTDIYLEPGVWKIFVRMEGFRRRPVYQEFLQVQATNLIPACKK